MSNRLFRSDCFFSSNVSTDLYVVFKRFGAILWPETAFTGPLISLMVSVDVKHHVYFTQCLLVRLAELSRERYWPRSQEMGGGGKYGELKFYLIISAFRDD